MEKRISHQQFQSVKAVAKACEPIYKKKDVLNAKIQKIVAEMAEYDSQIAALEAGIVKYVGFHVDDLIKRVVEVSEDNKKTVKYVPTDIVTYDAKTRQYIVDVPEIPEEVIETLAACKEHIDNKAINDVNEIIDSVLNAAETSEEEPNGMVEESTWEDEVLVTPASPEEDDTKDEWNFD